MPAVPVRYLCSAASSASSERLFSKAGLAMSKRRQRLTGDSLARIITVRGVITSGLLDECFKSKHNPAGRLWSRIWPSIELLAVKAKTERFAGVMSVGWWLGPHLGAYRAVVGVRWWDLVSSAFPS